MYSEFFGLKEKPFNLTPSPRFLFQGESHREALALLKYGVMERKGFLLLTGDVGTGKTTMIQAFLSGLDKSVPYVLLSNPLLSPTDFLDYLAVVAMGRKHGYGSKAEFLLEFEGFLRKCLRKRKIFLLIIDEAQKLSFELLEEIRLLSNMETGDEKLINIFLVGQPEINERLSESRCLPLLQRISIRFHIPPLNLQETRDYVGIRLKAAGAGNGSEIFSDAVIEVLHKYSGGYPRLINVLADNSLLLGYSMGKREITADMVRESNRMMMLPQDLQGKKPVGLGEAGEKGYSGEDHWGSL